MNDVTRRESLLQLGAGFGGLALTGLLAGDSSFGQALATTGQLSTKQDDDSVTLRLPTKVKSCIFLFMYGGPSQMDLFDYKPELQRRDGEQIDLEIRRRSIQKSTLLASRRTFHQHGESGLWCSDALPHLSGQMDKLAVIKSLYSDSFAHGSAMIQMNSGRVLQGYPSMGSWITYGLGNMNDSLPGYVVMFDPRGGPISGAANWSSGFMPAVYQGTVLRSNGSPILDLAPTSGATSEMMRDQIDTLNRLNRAHLERRSQFSELEARIASYELAFELQSAAPEALDLSQETEQTIEMYGVNDPVPDHRLAVGPGPFAQQCLMARRLVERGVRFVQIYHGGGHQQQNWDAHHGVEENLAIHCPEIDRPIAGLLQDLENRGLLEETLVVWGGEFGRQPVSQGDNGGRDHNPKGFTYWLAGGGVRAGTSYGETDDLGHEAAVDRHHLRDLHATILHLMGIDHRQLTYAYGGLDHKLTGVVEANVIEGVIA